MKTINNQFIIGGFVGFLERYTVQSRLLFVVALFVALLGMAGAVGWRIMNAGSQQSTMLMDEHIRPSGLLNQIRFLQADNRAQLLLSLQHDSTSPFISMHNHGLDFHLDMIASNTQKVGELIKEYKVRTIEDSREVELLKAFEESREKFVSEGVSPTVALLKSGDFMKANETLLKQVNPLFKAAADAGAALGNHILKAAEEEQRAFETEQRRILFGFGGTVAILVLGAIALTWVTLRSVIDPLRDIVQKFGAIAQGDLKQRIEVRGDNEITEVQKSLNRVQDEMRVMVQQILDAAHHISDGGRTLGTEVHVVVENSQAQSDGVMQVSAAMEEVTVSVGEVAQHTGQAASAAKEATRVVDVGAQAVEAEIRNTQQVVDAVEASTARMDQLREGIGRIGNVTQVIREVADQTNLLALNAAIEAARAGEQGRGFAVVADEVRKLAERTSASTADISRLIGEIQASAAQAVDAMQDARSKVEAAQQSARESGDSLLAMRSATDQVSGLTQQIALATDEQSSAAQAVAQSMERISALISDSHARVGRVEAVSKELIGMADQLQSAVRVFRV